MKRETLPETVSADGDTDAEHLVCPCSPEWAVCGVAQDPNAYKPDEHWTPGEVCILCEVAADELCWRCGQ